MKSNHDKKKLLVTASTFPRWEGDTEPRFILDLSKELTNYFDVTVLAPSCPSAKDREVIEGVNVLRYHYLPVHSWETLCYPGAIVPRIKEKKIRVLQVPFLLFGLWVKLLKILPEYDFVHAHWLIPQGIVQSFFRKPYFLTGHGGDVTSLNGGILRKMKIRTIKKAKGVSVVSETLAQEIKKLTPDVKVEVRSMGCDTQKFSPQNRIDNFFRQGDKKVILFVGRLSEKKGVSYLIDAMKQVNARLVIVGSGELETELKKQAEPLKDRIVFLGAKSHDELKPIYASADIFVAPSVTASNGDKEGLPTTIIEAMASGLPVVASDLSGIPEIIADGENGFLVKEKSVEDLSEKINCLLKNEKKSREMGRSAIETAVQYDYGVIAKRFAEILFDI